MSQKKTQTQFVTKLKKWKCDNLTVKTLKIFNCENLKTQIVTKRKNLNCDETQKLKLWQKSNSNCNTNQKLIFVQLNYWPNMKQSFDKNNLTPQHLIKCSLLRSRNVACLNDMANTNCMSIFLEVWKVYINLN